MEPTTLQLNYRKILEKVERARNLSPWKQPVTLIAVSKGQPVEAIQKLYQLGHRDFGENYVQEFLKKDEELRARGCAGIRWHFIGHLQTNKVKSLLPGVHCIHTVDSERLVAELIKRQRPFVETNSAFPIFIEVNIADEASKAGLPPSQVPEFVREVHQHTELRIQGLMCIPPVEGDSKGWFARLRELEQECRPSSRGMLSMGMSDDFEAAILEGATHVRVGTALFGTRQKFLA